jgi:hypothetical protein
VPDLASSPGKAAASGAVVATGVVLAATGVLPLVALPAFIPVAFAAWVFGPRRRKQVPPAPKPPDPAQLLDDFEQQIDGKVPQEIAARVHRITTTVRETLPRLDTLGPGSYTAHTVVATATSYLPEAVGAYMRLPRKIADTRPVSGHKTSMMILVDQLDLLAVEMDKVLLAVSMKDADALIAHGRFLAEKFGSGALALDPARRM